MMSSMEDSLSQEFKDVQGNVMPVRPVLARRSMKLRSLSPSLEESVSPKGYLFQRISSWFRAKLNLWKEGLPSLSVFIGCIVGTTLYILFDVLPPKFDSKVFDSKPLFKKFDVLPPKFDSKDVVMGSSLNLWIGCISIFSTCLAIMVVLMLFMQFHVLSPKFDSKVFDSKPLFNYKKFDVLPPKFDSKVFDSKPLFNYKKRNVLPVEHDCIIDKETEASERLPRLPNLNNQGSRLFYLKAHPFRMWKLGKCIGAGAFGQVYECNIPRGNYGGLCAVKIVKIEPQYTRSRKEVMLLKNEINILKKIRHNRVVAYYESAEKDNHLHLFMELMTGGSLSDRIKKKKVLSERESRKYAKQILEGVSFLHSIEIIHRDIKGSNVLLDKDKNVKLADFGLSKIIQKIGSKTNLLSHCGTPYWMAPEILWGKGYGRKADIWSVGCTVVEMLTGNPPLSDLEPTAAMFRIGSMPTEPNLPKDISKATKDLITATLTWDPKERPWSNDLLDKFFPERCWYFCQGLSPGPLCEC